MEIAKPSDYIQVARLDHALALLRKHDALARTRQDALGWSEKAKSALRQIPDHDVRQMLIDLADFVVARVS